MGGRSENNSGKLWKKFAGWKKGLISKLKPIYFFFVEVPEKSSAEHSPLPEKVYENFLGIQLRETPKGNLKKNVRASEF